MTACGALGGASGGVATPVSDEVARRLYGGDPACVSGQRKKDGSNTNQQEYCKGCGGSFTTCGTGVGKHNCDWNPCANATAASCLFPTYSGCMASPE